MKNDTNDGDESFSSKSVQRTRWKPSFKKRTTSNKLKTNEPKVTVEEVASSSSIIHNSTLTPFSTTSISSLIVSEEATTKRLGINGYSSVSNDKTSAGLIPGRSSVTRQSTKIGSYLIEETMKSDDLKKQSIKVMAGTAGFVISVIVFCTILWCIFGKRKKPGSLTFAQRLIYGAEDEDSSYYNTMSPPKSTMDKKSKASALMDNKSVAVTLTESSTVIIKKNDSVAVADSKKIASEKLCSSYTSSWPTTFSELSGTKPTSKKKSSAVSKKSKMKYSKKLSKTHL